MTTCSSLINTMSRGTIGGAQYGVAKVRLNDLRIAIISRIFFQKANLIAVKVLDDSGSGLVSDM